MNIPTPPRSRRARRFAIFLALLGCGLAGCASSVGAAAALTDAPVTLRPGAMVTLPDRATLRYVQVSADSRCPPDVQCIRAGDADVLFEFDPIAAPPRQLVLNTPQSPSAVVGDWRVRLLTLEFGPAPAVTIEFEHAEP